MLDNKKTYLDRAGLIKLWELVCEQFVDVTSYDLTVADLDSRLQHINEVLGEAGEGNQSIKSQIEAINNLIIQNNNASTAEDAVLANLIASNKDATDASIAALDAKIDEEISKLIADAPEILNTLKEISDWIADDPSGTTSLVNRVAALEEYEPLTEKDILELCEKIIATFKVNSSSSLKTAFNKGGIVKLVEDIALSEPVTIPEGKSVILNLEGKTITASGLNNIVADGGTLTIKNGTVISQNKPVVVTNGGVLEIDGATITSVGDSAVSVTGANSEVVFNTGNINSREAGILVTTGAKATMNGGTITSTDNGGIMGNGSPGQGDVDITMNGGTINASIISDGYVAVGVYMPNTGRFTMNGGTINVEGGAGLVARGGVNTLNGGTINTTAHPTLAQGKVGDSRVVVPCSAVVYDKDSKYPGSTDLEVIIGTTMNLNGAHEAITILTDEAEPKVTDNRPTA